MASGIYAPPTAPPVQSTVRGGGDALGGYDKFVEDQLRKTARK